MDLVPMSAFERWGALWLPRAIPEPPPSIPRPAPEPPRATIRMVGGRRMQCKDIPDTVFVEAVRRTPGNAAGWRNRWEVHAILELAVGLVPENLLMAKARRLIARGLVGGCPCGCRGDWHPTDECTDDPFCCRARRA